MKWNIDYYKNDLAELIFAMSPAFLARYIRLTELMQQYGPNLGMPHTKSIFQGLFDSTLAIYELVGTHC